MPWAHSSLGGVRPLFEPSLVREGLLTPGQPWRAVRFHAETPSTNDVARELVAAYAADPGGAPDPGWSVVVTDHQTGGRGRLGRAWEVPAGAAIAMSAVVPLQGGAHVASAAWLPLCAGLAVLRAIRQVTRAAGHEVAPTLKWPNDVLLGDDDDRKVSGILCELVSLGSPLGAANGAGGETAAAVVVVEAAAVVVVLAAAAAVAAAVTDLLLHSAHFNRRKPVKSKAPRHGLGAFLLPVRLSLGWSICGRLLFDERSRQVTTKPIRFRHGTTARSPAG